MVSWLPYMTSFCCCLGLENGARIVGTLHFLSSLGLLSACIVYAVELGGLVNTPADTDQLYTAYYRLAITVAVVCTAHLALATVLLVGSFKRLTKWVNFWIRVMIILLVTSLVMVAALCIKYGINDVGSDMFLSMLEGILFYGFVCYCILVVNSFYMKLKSSEDMEGPKRDY